MKKFLIIWAILIAIIIIGCKALPQEQIQDELMLKEKAEEQYASKNSGLPNHEEPINKYIITVDYDKKENTLTGHEKIIYYNNGNKTADSIVLYLYPNMYKNLETVPAIGSAEKSYPEGFNPGYIKLSNIKVDGREVGKSIEEEFSGIYIEFPLEKPVRRNKSIEIDMDFMVKIPISTTRFGQYKDITQFTYWYPILAIEEDGGWQVRDYSKIGESNYSHIADYHVEIKLPEEEKIAATGSIISERQSSEKGYKHVDIKAEKVRDFAWVCSPNFIIEESIIDGIKIKNYYTPKNKALGCKADEIGVDVLTYFNEKFGPYPYHEFTIVETYLTGGGMEYPQLIALGQNHYKDMDKLVSVIAHEGAHQWWYVGVGNDEHESPWLDEGFATYSTQLYLAHRAKDDKKLNELMAKYETLQSPDIAIDASVSCFSNWKDYNDVIYKKGALVLHKLRNDVGDDRFFEIMQNYYNRYKFRNATNSDFLSVVEEVAGKAAVEKIDLH